MGHVQTENTHHAQIPGKFALVAHSGQRLVGVGICGGLAHDGEEVSHSNRKKLDPLIESIKEEKAYLGEKGIEGKSGAGGELQWKQSRLTWSLLELPEMAVIIPPHC